MMQIKKWLISFGLLAALVLPISANGNEKSRSDVAEQKSVIDEQQEIQLNAGVGIPLEEIVNIKQIKSRLATKKIIEEYISRYKVEPRSKFADIIDNLTENEKKLICQITQREAGNQCVEGKRAIMEVIFNRIEDKNFPNTVQGVLSQSGQFSTWRLRNKVTSEQIDNIYQLFDVVYKEEPVLAGNYVYFDSVKHSYGKNYVKIQGHWFGTR